MADPKLFEDQAAPEPPERADLFDVLTRIMEAFDEGPYVVERLEVRRGTPTQYAVRLFQDRSDEYEGVLISTDS